MKSLNVLACCILGLAAGWSRAAAAEATAESQTKQTTPNPTLTIVNIASHCDWSWGHTRAWHEERCANMIHDYLMLMRKNPKLVWQLETVNEQLLPFLAKARRQWPELIDEFWRRVKEGRIEVVCAYSNPRLSEVYPELFVRSLVLGKEYFRRHVPGIRQDVFEVPDVMCGTSQVPQILTLAGYRYFMFTRIVGQEAVFWRKGLDGTRMLSSKDVYGYPEFQGTPGASFKGIKPVPIWRHAIGCDDMPPTQAIIDQAQSGDPNKQILSSMLRFFEECEKHSGEITELSGSLDSCNNYTMAGMHGNQNIHTLNNRNEDLLLSLEKAQAMAAILDRPFYGEPVDALWQEVLSSTGHAIEWCWKEDYAERMAQARHTREKASRFLEDALCAIAGGIPFAPDRGTPLVVFNFQGWSVSGPVEVAIDGGVEGLELTDSAGSKVPLQLMTEDVEGSPRAAFNATAVPACGFKTYYFTRAKDAGPVAANDGKTAVPAIENEFYRITVRPNGQLEVFDKASKVVLGSPQTGGLGDLAIYDMPRPNDTWLQIGPLGKRRDWQPAVAQCRVVQGPVFSSLTIPGKIDGHAITREVRLWRGNQRIEFGVDLNTAQRDDAIFCIRFPIGLSGKVAAGIPFGVESRDDLEKEPFRGESFATGFPEGYDATRWTDVSSPQFGYTFICPPGMHTGYAFKKGDQSIEFILNTFRPLPKDVFARAATSVEGRGHHHWWCALAPHVGTWSDAKSYRQAMEQHVPLLAWSTAYGLGRGGAAAYPDSNKPDRPQQDIQPRDGIRPQTVASVVEVTPANVVLSAMRLVPSAKPGERPPVELRLYETAGQAADVAIRLARPAVSVEQTNFLGEPMPHGSKVQIAGNEIRFHIEPWKIVTLRVRDREPNVQETREGNYSVIRIKSPEGGEKVYRIDLSASHSPASEKTEVLKKWESYRLGAFVCFNTNQFTGEEFCKTRDPKVYNPRQLDVAGWVTAFKAAGMKYVMLTTRHTSGFLLWDSATTNFDVAQSGNTTDVCKEFVKECRRQGLIPAFYYCLWGGKDWNPDPNARAVILAQLYELATQYGEIPYFWIDMKRWTPDDLSTQEIYDCLKSLQPNCAVEFNQHVQDGTQIAYFPTDIIDGEMTPPPAGGHNPLRTVGGKKYYLPFDYNFVSQNRAGGYDTDPLGPSCWFTYGEGKSFAPSRPFPAEAVAKRIRLGYKRGAGNVLLATAPDHSGRMRPQDVEQLRRLGRILRGEEPALPTPISRECRATASSVWEDKPEWAAEKAVDGDSEIRWGGGVGTKQGWLELDLGSAKRFDAVLIEEGWGRIQRFEVQVKENDQWRTIVEGKEIGPYSIRRIAPTTARNIRLNVLEASDAPTIWEFQLFDGFSR